MGALEKNASLMHSAAVGDPFSKTPREPTFLPCMTVADLIAHLSTLPLDAMVLLAGDEEGNSWGTTYIVSVEATEHNGDAVVLWPGVSHEPEAF